MARRKPLALAAAAVALSFQVLAVPRVEVLVGVPKTDVVCRVHLSESAEPGSLLVLQWSSTQAEMRIDGREVTLGVQEQHCGRQCVGPGRSGVRIYRFRADGIDVAFRKQVACARHAEVCSGLPDGEGRLSVSTPRGTRILAVRKGYCDL